MFLFKNEIEEGLNKANVLGPLIRNRPRHGDAAMEVCFQVLDAGSHLPQRRFLTQALATDSLCCSALSIIPPYNRRG